MTKPNGHDKSNITRFPDRKERAAAERVQSEAIINLPPVVKVLTALNIIIFLAWNYLPQVFTQEMLYQLAFVPARYFGDLPFDLSAIASPFTHMFLHAGWLHVGINVGTLMAFGSGLEKLMGGKKLLLLYFGSGLCGALLHAAFFPHSDNPMIGASGAISGLFGAVIVMMYRQGMMSDRPPERGLAGYKKLLPFIILWVGISAFFGFFGMPGVDNPIAWTTHIGGFLAGLLLYIPISRLRIY